MRFLQLPVLFLAAWAPAAWGQAEHLAPFVPSPQLVVEKMLQAAGLKPHEVLYDLGSGDGRVVITAAQKFRAKAVGVELSQDLCQRALREVKLLGLQDRVEIINADLLTVDLSPADVVILYLLTSSNDRLKPNLQKYLKPGARVVSHDFKIRGWKPARIAEVEVANRVHTIYVYEMGPAPKK